MTEKVDVEEFFNNPAEPDVSIELVNLKVQAGFYLPIIHVSI